MRKTVGSFFIIMLLCLFTACGERIRSGNNNNQNNGTNPNTLTADAGANQTLTDNDNNGTETVLLNASASNGSITNYTWELNGNPLGTGISLQTTLGVGAHLITLVISDGQQQSTDTVTITINPAPTPNTDPVADAGPDQTVSDADNSGDESITLDGSNSSDVDGDILSFNWIFNNTSIGNTDIITYDFPIGTHTITLEVDDGNGGTDTDDVIVTVGPGNNATPTVTAPADSTIVTNTMTLTPTANDADNDPLTFSWSLGPQAPVAEVLISAPANDGSVTVTVPRNGIYTFDVQVDDGNGGQSGDSVTITVNAPNPLQISASISEGQIGSQSGVSNLTCELQWLPLNNSNHILTSTSDGNGDISFDQLIGNPSDFAVFVPGN